MKFRKLRKVSIMLLLILSLNSWAYADACNNLLTNCMNTALQEYQNGNYDIGTYYLFTGTICPGAHASCVDIALDQQ